MSRTDPALLRSSSEQRLCPDQCPQGNRWRQAYATWVHRTSSGSHGSIHEEHPVVGYNAALGVETVFRWSGDGSFGEVRVFVSITKRHECVVQHQCCWSSGIKSSNLLEDQFAILNPALDHGTPLLWRAGRHQQRRSCCWLLHSEGREQFHLQTRGSLVCWWGRINNNLSIQDAEPIRLSVVNLYLSCTEVVVARV